MFKDVDGRRHADLKQAYQELLLKYHAERVAYIEDVLCCDDEALEILDNEVNQLSKENLNRPFREEV